MAELPSLGEHCSWQECKDLDFLPIICQFCKRKFCKLHFLPEQHACTDVPKKMAVNLERTDVRYECGLEGCKKWELAPVLCNYCQLQVCLSHRHQEDHKCTKLEARQRTMQSTKKHVDNIIKSQSSAVVKPKGKVRSKAAQKTAAKVQLMKLKMKSKGQNSLPDSERVYFLVHPPKENGKAAMGCFISKTWSIGKTIDTLADLTGTVNDNNVGKGRKLRIFRDDEEELGSSLEVKLTDLLTADAVFNGDTVHLEYVSDSCSC